eukprot:3052754-Prymnesium_polylepis.1
MHALLSFRELQSHAHGFTAENLSCGPLSRPAASACAVPSRPARSTRRPPMPPPPAATAPVTGAATVKSQGKWPPITNESIRKALKEFFEESEDFRSPKAEAKWGPIAEWDVSQ